MYNILSLSEDLECLGGLIHNQCGVSLQDLRSEDLDRVLSIAHGLLLHLDVFFTVLRDVQILLIGFLLFLHHLLEDLVVLRRCRHPALGKYLLMRGFVGDKGIQ